MFKALSISLLSLFAFANSSIGQTLPLGSLSSPLVEMVIGYNAHTSSATTLEQMIQASAYTTPEQKKDLLALLTADTKKTPKPILKAKGDTLSINIEKVILNISVNRFFDEYTVNEKKIKIGEKTDMKKLAFAISDALSVKKSASELKIRKFFLEEAQAGPMTELLSKTVVTAASVPLADVMTSLYYMSKVTCPEKSDYDKCFHRNLKTRIELFLNGNITAQRGKRKLTVFKCDQSGHLENLQVAEDDFNRQSFSFFRKNNVIVSANFHDHQGDQGCNYRSADGKNAKVEVKGNEGRHACLYQNEKLPNLPETLKILEFDHKVPFSLFDRCCGNPECRKEVEYLLTQVPRESSPTQNPDAAH